MMIQIRRTDFLQGSTRLDLVDDAGRSLSHLDGIVPLTLHFGKDQAFVVDLPQATLARLIFGATSAADILDHDGIRVGEPGRQFLGVLFPAVRPHVYLPDHC